MHRQIAVLAAVLVCGFSSLSTVSADPASSVDGISEELSEIYRSTEPASVFGSTSVGHTHAGRRGKADKHAPAGLMGDHVHEQGEWMVEYKYMNMYMEDNIVGSREISDPAGPVTVNGITTGGIAVPTQMTMEMHMVHLMYGLTDDITVYTMLNLPSITMDHNRGPANPGLGAGPGFTTHNSGFGDTQFGALVRLFDDEDDDLILNLGSSVPTGDIFRTSSIPTAGLGPGYVALPYPMRLCSGTFNFRPGLTWKHYNRRTSHGLQFQSDLPLGRNYRGYSVSDVYRLNGWVSYLVNDNLALTTRIENLWKSNYDGNDPSTPNAAVHTNVESFRGGYWANLGLGAALLVKGQLVNVEFIPNLYQDVDGIQLETDWSFVVSWSTSF
jgi:hypothetical protein